MPQRPSPLEELHQWSAVDRYVGGLLGDTDAVLEATLRSSAAAGLPQIQVSPLQGKLLQLLAQLSGARRILEIGTLGGYSTTWLARALPADGRLVSLERDERHANVARANLARAGLADRVEIRLGRALDSLASLERESVPPFDLTFVDADKPSYAEYLGWALRLSHPGSVILADNVVRRGEIVDPASDDPSVGGVRRMFEAIAREARLSATVVQTVGVKGYDGLLVAVVRPEPTKGPAPP